MIRFVLQEQKKFKNILILLGIFLGLLTLYTFLDNFGYQSYATLGDAFGYNTVVATITLNVLISLISAATISFTIINFRFNNAMSSGGIISSIGNVFAVVFTGCASCGLSLLGAIGLSIGLPAVTPGAVKYKFFALLIIILGMIIVVYLINNSTCSIKKGGKQ
jgi:hypothetical protein